MTDTRTDRTNDRHTDRKKGTETEITTDRWTREKYNTLSKTDGQRQK